MLKNDMPHNYRINYIPEHHLNCYKVLHLYQILPIDIHNSTEPWNVIYFYGLNDFGMLHIHPKSLSKHGQRIRY